MTLAERDKLDLAAKYESHADLYRQLGREAKTFDVERKYKLQAHHLVSAARSLTETMPAAPFHTRHA